MLAITVKRLSGVSSTAEAFYYEVVKIHTNGVFIPGLIEKEFALNYERAGTSGTNFKPIRESPTSMYGREGYAVVANGGGWRQSGNTDEIRGAQIKDGVVYHDFELAQNGAEALGFKADGSSKGYSILDGDSAASMATDGVLDCFSFGPLLVRNGVAVDIEAQPLWDAFNNEVSARQIMGQSATGDIIVITVTGESGVSGIKGNDASQLAFDHGCHNAIMLDGGGSAQTLVQGSITHQSSDGVARNVPDFVCVNLRVNSPNGILRQLIT